MGTITRYSIDVTETVHYPFRCSYCSHTADASITQRAPGFFSVHGSYHSAEQERHYKQLAYINGRDLAVKFGCDVIRLAPCPACGRRNSSEMNGKIVELVFGVVVSGAIALGGLISGISGRIPFVNGDVDSDFFRGVLALGGLGVGAIGCLFVWMFNRKLNRARTEVAFADASAAPAAHAPVYPQAAYPQAAYPPAAYPPAPAHAPIVAPSAPPRAVAMTGPIGSVPAAQRFPRGCRVMVMRSDKQWHAARVDEANEQEVTVTLEGGLQRRVPILAVRHA